MTDGLIHQGSCSGSKGFLTSLPSPPPHHLHFGWFGLFEVTDPVAPTHYPLDDELMDRLSVHDIHVTPLSLPVVS